MADMKHLSEEKEHTLKTVSHLLFRNMKWPHLSQL